MQIPFPDNMCFLLNCTQIAKRSTLAFINCFKTQGSVPHRSFGVWGQIIYHKIWRNLLSIWRNVVCNCLINSENFANFVVFLENINLTWYLQLILSLHYYKELEYNHNSPRTPNLLKTIRIFRRAALYNFLFLIAALVLNFLSFKIMYGLSKTEICEICLYNRL